MPHLDPNIRVFLHKGLQNRMHRLTGQTLVIEELDYLNRCIRRADAQASRIGEKIWVCIQFLPQCGLFFAFGQNRQRFEDHFGVVEKKRPHPRLEVGIVSEGELRRSSAERQNTDQPKESRHFSVSLERTGSSSSSCRSRVSKLRFA